MKVLLIWLACFSALWSGGAAAQAVQLFSPPERDFRVLMPGSPQRFTTPDGSVEFRSDTGVYQYSVFRHDPRRLAGGANVGDDIAKRISKDDQTARSNAEQTLPRNEFMFRVGPTQSMHRAFVESGRYYELVVQAQPGEGMSETESRDFFSSFQMGRASGFQGLTNVPAPEACQGRPSAFSRRFCEYVSCTRAGTENHPVCRSLPMLRLE